MISTARQTNLSSTPRSDRFPAKIDPRLEQLSHWMDTVFRVPGTDWRFGLDAILGLLPGVGDSAGAFVSLYILAAAVRQRVPRVTIMRMAMNVGLDYVLGSVPIVGDLFDAAWKANRKNVELLRRRATLSAAQAQKGTVGDWGFVAGLFLMILLLLIGSTILSLFLLWHLVAYFKAG